MMPDKNLFILVNELFLFTLLIKETLHENLEPRDKDRTIMPNITSKICTRSLQNIENNIIVKT